MGDKRVVQRLAHRAAKVLLWHWHRLSLPVSSVAERLLGLLGRRPRQVSLRWDWTGGGLAGSSRGALGSRTRTADRAVLFGGRLDVDFGWAAGHVLRFHRSSRHPDGDVGLLRLRLLRRLRSLLLMCRMEALVLVSGDCHRVLREEEVVQSGSGGDLAFLVLGRRDDRLRLDRCHVSCLF